MKQKQNKIKEKVTNDFFLLFLLTNAKTDNIIVNVLSKNRYGDVAQLARAFGSYPKGHVFESHRRYQRLRAKLI